MEVTASSCPGSVPNNKTRNQGMVIQYHVFVKKNLSVGVLCVCTFVCMYPCLHVYRGQRSVLGFFPQFPPLLFIHLFISLERGVGEERERKVYFWTRAHRFS